MMKKKKLFGIFNIVDISILAILVIAASSVFIYFNAFGKSGDDVNVYFTVEFREVHPEILSRMIIGSEAYEAIGGDYIGIIHSVKELRAERTIYNEVTGEFAEVEFPERVTIQLTIKADGTESDTDIAAEGIKIRMGTDLSIKGKGFTGYGFVVELKTEKK